MSDYIVREDMDDWWGYQQQLEEEMRQLELEGMEVPVRVEPQEDHELTVGTFLQGHVYATYYELVRAFGDPLQGDGTKTRAEWALIFTLPDEDDEAIVVATVYDWKQYDTAVESVSMWNIGGKDPRAVEAVIDYLNYVRDMETLGQLRA